MVIFLYQLVSGEKILTERPIKEMKASYGELEVLYKFHELESALIFLQKKNITFLDLVKRRGISTSSRDKMREKKLGHRNPNYKGLSEQHRKNISRGMKGKNVEYMNVNYMKSRDLTTKMKISVTKKAQARARKRRWCLSDKNEEFLVYWDTILPPGWIWGRKRFTIRLRTR